MTLFWIGLAIVVVAGCIPVFADTQTSLLLHKLALVAGSGVTAVAAASVLVTGVAIDTTIPAAVPGGAWRFGIDALSAVFLLVVLFVGAACAIFGVSDRSHRPGRFAPFAFAMLLAAIAFVIVARNVVGFLGAWEIMAISSYLLIVTHHEEADVRRAGLLYLVATHTATLALFAMFATWAVHATDWSFAALAAASPALTTRAVTAILLLALVGFGFKAGALPFHFWLPPAHSAAPSHVSALMSGVVIKTGIYGLLRMLLMLGGAPSWFGGLVFGIGVASGILGVLWALAQHDFKRLLAYHSVENIGIIFMGIGVGVMGVAHNAPAVAVVGFAGGLLHTVNHALFKSLLFLGAGNVYRATGTRNMEDLGGLARRMPLTWIGFVVGAAAIIGVPPFNGFVSEWLVYQGMFLGAQPSQAGLARLVLLGIPALALIGALALACFAKVAGVVFLGAPRSSRSATADDGNGGLYAPALALAVACLAIGVLPLLGVTLVQSAASQLTGAPGVGIPAVVVSSAWKISAFAAVIVVSTAIVWRARSLLARRNGVRENDTWACGYGNVTPRMQYTASSFAAPLLSVFGKLSGVHVVRTESTFETHPVELVLGGIAMPIWNALHRSAQRMRPMQQGRLHVYLLYVLAALLVMLAYLAFGGAR